MQPEQELNTLPRGAARAENEAAEPSNIVKYLQRKGYEVGLENGRIVVQDSVQVYGRGGSRTEYQKVFIADWRAAIAFIEVRS